MMTQIVDYVSSLPSEADRFASIRNRLIAGSFAVGETIWSIFGLIMLLTELSLETLLFFSAYFGPFYVLGAGYYWRAFGKPSVNWRRVLWSASLLMQGGWVAYCGVLFVLQGSVAADPVLYLNLLWCAGIAVTSIVMIIKDTRPHIKFHLGVTDLAPQTIRAETPQQK